MGEMRKSDALPLPIPSMDKEEWDEANHLCYYSAILTRN